VDSDKFYEWLKRFPCYSQIRGYFESNEWEPYLGTVILDGKTYWAVFTQPKRYILLDDNTGYIPPMS